MRHERRLRELVAATARERATTGQPEEYCRECLGSHGFRRVVERVRECMETGAPFLSTPTCRNCGGDTLSGSVTRERHALGLA
jgi:hypothetical protein